MAIRPVTPNVCDTVAETQTATTDCDSQSLHCKEDNIIYRKRQKADGSGLEWYNPKQMLKPIYDTNESGVVDDSEKLGGESPSSYAKAADLSAKQDALAFSAPLVKSGTAVSLPNLSGTNTGDETNASILQKIGYVPENQANKSADVNADQTSASKYPCVKAVFDWAKSLFVQKNAAIAANTKPKITYDANGLVTAGADLTAADIPVIPGAKVSGLASVAVSGNYADLTNKPAIQTISYFNAAGAISITKRWIAVVGVTTASGNVIDISSAGFTSITGFQVIAISNTNVATNCPQVAVKTFSVTQLVVNITTGSSTLVSILGTAVSSLLFPASVSGISLSVVVEGN